MSGPAVVLREVVKRSGKATVLDGISATIQAGQLVGVVGPSGAGKTMLLRLIAGLLRPDAGQVEVLGRDPAREGTAVQALIGYLPQRCGLHDELTSAENLKLHADLHDLTEGTARVRVDALSRALDLVHLGDRRIRTLPIEARRKLALACALIGEPRLVLLDEPTAGLDPGSQRELFRLAAALAEGGTSVLWSTTSFEEAERCAYVLLLHEGRLLGQGTPAEIAARLAGRTHTVRAVGPDRRRVAARLWAAPGVRDVRVRAGAVRFLTDAPGSAVAPDRLAGRDAIGAVPPSLEDAFIARQAGQDTGPVPVTARSEAGTSVPGPCIAARGLTKRFGDLVAVEGTNLAVAAGEIVGLVGPADAGKTTILRILAGLLSPTAGEARVAGADPRSAPAATRARLGCMSQKFSLYGELTVARNLRFCAGIFGVERGQRGARIERLMAELGLGSRADTRADDLSTGDKQRLALAATLVHEPEIVLLDEPTAGVDPATRRDLWFRIDAVSAAGAAVLVALRDMTEAEACDRVLLLHRGRGIAAGRPDELVTAVATHDGSEPTLADAFVAFAGSAEREGRGR